FSEPLQELQIPELAILPGRVNLLHRRQSLRITKIAAERQPAVHAEIDAGIVEIAERPAAGGDASAIAERPGLESAAAAIPEVVRIAKAQGVKLAGERHLGVWAQQQDAVAILGGHHVEGR